MIVRAEKMDLSNEQILEKEEEIAWKSLGVSRQNYSTLLWLRISEIGIPVFLCLISIFAIKLYPLSEKTHV